nr:ulp1 protease family, C-terminal catalytic domain-containing protein [Tanacetum cinerariifolium]
MVLFVAGKDPLIGVLGPEHPWRTRALSSVVGFKKALGSVGCKRKKKVTIEDLEGMRAQMMEDMETIVRVKVMEELVVQGNNTTLQGPSIGHSDGHSTRHSTGLSAESVDTFDEIEECELMFVHFRTECRVAKGVIYLSNGMLHGKPMDPGFLKIQVDTVDDGWDEVIVPKPTDKVKTLKDVKGGQFIQWPRKYIKVLRKMPSNDSMSLPTSIPPLTSLTTSTPVLCQMVIA